MRRLRGRAGGVVDAHDATSQQKDDDGHDGTQPVPSEAQAMAGSA
jgi:hypothetical protein